MPDLTPAAQEWLSLHHGVVTTARLSALGVRAPTRRRLARSGVLRPVERGVFVLSTTPASLEQRCAVLCASHPTGFVTGPTAGILLGLRRMPRRAPLHVALRHGLHVPLVAGVAFHQTTVIGRDDRATRPDGIVTASPTRLAFDLAATLPALDHRSAVEQLVELGLTTADELAAIDLRLGHPARPGSGAFRRTLEHFGSPGVAQSHPEVALAAALEAAGVPVVRQHAVVLPGGVRVHLDLAAPLARWGVELDVHPEHRTVEGHARDAARRRGLHASGWQVEVVAEADVGDPGRVQRLAAELASLYRGRLRTLAA